MVQCKGTTQRGQRCRNSGSREGYCHHHVGQDKWTGPTLPNDSERDEHARQGYCSGVTQLSRLCRRRTAPGFYCYQHGSQATNAKWQYQEPSYHQESYSSGPQSARHEPQEQPRKQQRNTHYTSQEWADLVEAIRRERARQQEESKVREELRKAQEARSRQKKEEEERARQQREKAQEEINRRRAREEQEKKARERRAREEQTRKMHQQDTAGAGATRKSTNISSEADRAEFIRQQKAKLPSRRTRAYTSWTARDAVDEFVKRSEGFLSSRSALTFSSIPWPVLKHTNDYTLEDITWDNVAMFLRTAETVWGPRRFGLMLKKSLTMFHPDRWAASSVPSRIKDSLERDCVLYGGNIVAQAIGARYAQGNA